MWSTWPASFFWFPHPKKHLAGRRFTPGLPSDQRFSSVRTVYQEGHGKCILAWIEWLRKRGDYKVNRNWSKPAFSSSLNLSHFTVNVPCNNYCSVAFSWVLLRLPINVWIRILSNCNPSLAYVFKVPINVQTRLCHITVTVSFNYFWRGKENARRIPAG